MYKRIFLIVLDSLGMLASEKEYNDALQGEDKVDLTRPKQLRSIFRIITHQALHFLYFSSCIIFHYLRTTRSLKTTI